MHAHSPEETRNRSGGAQRVFHHGAAAGAEFDQRHRIGRAQQSPDVRGPQADQFAKHLADFRRGDEIAASAERGAPIVVAVLGVVEAHGHEFRDRNRSVARDAGADFCLQRGAMLRHG